MRRRRFKVADERLADIFPSDRADLARRLQAFIDYWHFETFHGSPLADHGDCWKFVCWAIEDLKARIVTQI